MQRYDWFLREYYPYIVPSHWNCVICSADMEAEVNCASCGRLLPYGESYTSMEIHNFMGLGYAVCEKCYKAECFRRSTAKKRRSGIMKRVYKCNFCDNIFESESEAEIHEKRCGRNPNNKINDKLVFRLSMIYESLPKIIACALYEVANNELDFLYTETERANSTNCPYTIKQNKSSMLYALRYAKTVANKHKGRNSSTYKDVVKENPELFQAIVDTLRRKAWNESER